MDVCVWAVKRKKKKTQNKRRHNESVLLQMSGKVKWKFQKSNKIRETNKQELEIDPDC